MKVIITGGLGFLGQGIARALLKRGSITDPAGVEAAIDSIVLFDQTLPAELPTGLDDPRVAFADGDIADKGTVRAILNRDDIAVFHLASVVSAGGEKDFDGAMAVNLDGMLNVLEALREKPKPPRLVFASSLAVFGADPGGDVSDTTKPVPKTTYGMTKTMCEMLINDYARKGFVDGRTARLATVIIRPGRPNAAASSFASGLFREPLRGEECFVPVPDDTPLALMGYRSCVGGLIGLMEADGAAIDAVGGGDRAMNLPNQTWTVTEMKAALKRVGEARGLSLGLVTERADPLAAAIVTAWPRSLDAARALKLGLPADDSLDAIVGEYLEDFA